MPVNDYLSFHLSEEFISPYRSRKVEWGFTDAGGTSLGEITFLRTYSRLKGDGTKERWWEVCRRVIEGMFSIQKDHCKTNRLPWNDHKAQRTAQDAFERMFTFKWTPPGRGLWMMGTPLVNRDKNSAALQNCAFVSTADMTKTDPTAPFTFLMEASMLGIGVGFDDKGADKGFKIYQPGGPAPAEYVIPDSREGWVESVKLLLESYLMPGRRVQWFDYTKIRPVGEPIKTFGGTAAGHEPLLRLHKRIRRILDDRDGATLTRKDIADLGNLIGCCVVSGNVRRSAELLIGHIDDKEFINLKNPQWFFERNYWKEDADPDALGWGHMSNNSVEAKVGDNYDHLIESIALNGEPGIVWMDLSRQYGRLIDQPNNKDWRVAGYNPCAEQSLESYECCTLVETFLNRHNDLEDYKRTLKVAYLYAKTVTLLPTHWQRTNAIMQRNRRIGCSMSGMANFADINGMTKLRTWMNEGYASIDEYDQIYSEWLGIRESIKKTTVKPSGTVSLLAGESPGAHWAPGGRLYHRTIRFAMADPMVAAFRQAGYRIEPDVREPNVTAVVYFPIRTDAERAEKDVTIFEKANLAVLAQRYWSDNSVSVTVSFNPENEGRHIGTILHMHEGQLKTVSFLPDYAGVYPQMPYSEITEKEYEEATMTLFKVDLDPIYDGTTAALDAVGEAYCTTSSCEMKEIVMSERN
jgi:ribonucleoside-triphosphate reductase